MNILGKFHDLRVIRWLFTQRSGFIYLGSVLLLHASWVSENVRKRLNIIWAIDPIYNTTYPVLGRRVRRALRVTSGANSPGLGVPGSVSFLWISSITAQVYVCQISSPYDKYSLRKTVWGGFKICDVWFFIVYLRIFSAKSGT